MNSLFFEKYWPLAAAIIVGVLWFFSRLRLPADYSGLIAGSIALGGVLAGFLAASQSILLALPPDSVVGRLRRGDQLQPLVRYISTAFYSSLGFAVLCLSYYFIDRTKTGWGFDLERALATTWAATGAFALFTIIRISRLMLKIFKVG